MTGKVKNFIKDRGFGFIRGEDGSEYFFHMSALPATGTVAIGQKVTFEPKKSAKGPRAEMIEFDAG